MSHVALDIENWEKVIFDEEFNFSYNYRVVSGLKISATKFYFFLKEKAGQPNVQFSAASKYFPERDVITGMEWCYLFKSGSNFILVTGDDRIFISVLSIEEPPSELDFEIFEANISVLLENQDIIAYEDSSFNIYVNYNYLLSRLITDYKSKLKERLPTPPKLYYNPMDESQQKSSERKYQQFEYAHDYNEWVKATLERATLSLQIQILLPIYFESLIDLAFRIKLRKEYFDFTINYGDEKYKKNIFEYFEHLPLKRKLEEINEKCFEINNVKLKEFIKKNIDYKTRRKRNLMLHGNSTFLQNLNLKFYLDENFLIGVPDRHNAIRAIPESLYNTVSNSEVFSIIKHYEKRSAEFLNIFDDKGFFKTLVQGIVFGHNPTGGGAMAYPVKNLDDLFLPKEE